jgi:hypothetical protein
LQTALVVETVFDASYAKELRKIPLAGNAVGRRISEISSYLCEDSN